MICFDTSPVIWGIQGAGGENPAGNPERTIRYIGHLKQTGERIMVPTPVLTEYLLGFPVERHDAQVAILAVQCFIPSLDIPSARLAARLQADSRMMKELRNAYGIDRQSLRVDAMTIAIAIIHGASKIITSDLDHFVKLAAGRIEVSGVPDVPEQKELFPPE